jgi:hypothetical protein
MLSRDFCAGTVEASTQQIRKSSPALRIPVAAGFAGAVSDLPLTARGGGWTATTHRKGEAV